MVCISYTLKLTSDILANVFSASPVKETIFIPFFLADWEALTIKSVSPDLETAINNLAFIAFTS